MVYFSHGKGIPNIKQSQDLKLKGENKMRVTKTIREYIEKEVHARVEPKFEAEKLEAKRQEVALSDFLECASKAAKAAWMSYFDERFSEIADFCEDERYTEYGTNIPTFYHRGAATIKDRCYSHSIHRWYEHINEESKRIVNEIIVELELGGTKAELMAMLEKI